MSIESAIVNLINSNDDLVELIDEKIYPINLPQDTALPAIVYQQIIETEPMTTEGALGLIESRFQITCWADSHNDCVELAEKLRAALADASGIYAGVIILHIQVVGRGDIPAIDIEAEQISRFGKFIDFIVSYEN